MNGAHTSVVTSLCHWKFAFFGIFTIIFMGCTYVIDYSADFSLRGMNQLSTASPLENLSAAPRSVCLEKLAKLREGVRDFPSCEDKRVHRLVDFLDSAAAANIHVFPRNGLLLGVVRHRGFMPSEDPPDIDLGIMYSDLGTILDLPDFGFKSIRGDGRYQLVVDTTLPSWNVVRRN